MRRNDLQLENEINADLDATQRNSEEERDQIVDSDDSSQESEFVDATQKKTLKFLMRRTGMILSNKTKFSWSNLGLTWLKLKMRIPVIHILPLMHMLMTSSILMDFRLLTDPKVKPQTETKLQLSHPATQLEERLVTLSLSNEASLLEYQGIG